MKILNTATPSQSKVGALRLNSTMNWVFGFIATFLFLAAWAFSSPIGATPDEDYHLVSIWCAQGERPQICAPGTKDKEVSAPTALVISANCYAFHPENSAACMLPDSQSFSLTTRSNADGGYPPIFYWVMSFFASPRLELSVLAMRLFNAALFTGLLALTLRFSPIRMRMPILGGFIISAIPLGAFLIPSVNPSSWAITSAVVLWGALTGYFQSEIASQKWTLLGISIAAAIIGAGARSDSAIYACIALVIAVVLSRKYIQSKPLSLIPALTILPIAIAFYLRSGQSSVISSAPSGNGFSLQLAISNLTELPGLWLGSLGTWGLGWLDTQMPAIVWTGTLLVFFGFVFLGAHRFDLPKVLVLSILIFAITVIPLYVLVHDNISVGSGVQPRYIYPLLIMIAGAALWEIKLDQAPISKLQIVIASLALISANSIALHTNIRRYVTGTDAGGFNLNANLEWWWNIPISPLMTWGIGTVMFVIAIFFVAKLVWQTTNRTAPKS